MQLGFDPPPPTAVDQITAIPIQARGVAQCKGCAQRVSYLGPRCRGQAHEERLGPQRLGTPLHCSCLGRAPGEKGSRGAMAAAAVSCRVSAALQAAQQATPRGCPEPPVPGRLLGEALPPAPHDPPERPAGTRARRCVGVPRVPGLAHRRASADAGARRRPRAPAAQRAHRRRALPPHAHAERTRRHRRAAAQRLRHQRGAARAMVRGLLTGTAGGTRCGSAIQPCARRAPVRRTAVPRQ